MIGLEVGSYVLESELGKGGMGEVYLGRHKSLGRWAAVKVMAPAFSTDGQLRERFSREARTQAQLDHPHVARVLDHVEKDGRWFLIIEYMAGGTLEAAIDRSREPVPVAQALAWSRQALLGLDYAHCKGIIHRDVKPANILINDRGEAAVTDFGIAMELGARRLTRTGTSMGTPEYMSPEQIRGAELDHRTDVYSLGIVLYELLAGRVPFQSPSTFEVQRAQVSDPPPPLGQINCDVSPELEGVVMRALAKDPKHRYSGCGEFAQAIASYERGDLTAGSPPPPRRTVLETPGGELIAQPSPTVVVGPAGGEVIAQPPRPVAASSPRRSWKRLPWAAAAAVVAVVAATLFWSGPSEKQRQVAVAAAQRARDQAATAQQAATTATAAAEEARKAADQAKKEAQKAAGAGNLQAAENAATAAEEETTKARGAARTAETEASRADQAATQAEAALGEARSVRTAAMRGPDARTSGGAVASAWAAGNPQEEIERAVREAEEAARAARTAATTAGLAAANAAVAVGEAEEAVARAHREVRNRARRKIERTRPPPLPAKPVVAVVAFGERLFAGHLETALENRLVQVCDVRDERRSPALGDLLRRQGDRTSVSDLTPALKADGFHVLVLVRVEVVDQRVLHYLDRPGVATQSRLRLNAWRLPDQKAVGRGWTENVEYTQINPKIIAERAFPDLSELVTAIEDGWDSYRSGR